MSIHSVAEKTKPVKKRKLGALQAKIDQKLIARTRIVAARMNCPPRDVVEKALLDYLPKAERDADRLEASGEGPVPVG
jgi:hypothetical protein